jgi:hypothetical protein
MDSEKINPYAAPAVVETPVAEVASDATGKYGAYRDNRKLAAWLTGLLVIGTLIHFARGGFNLLYTLTDFAADVERVELIEKVLRGIGWSGIACMIVFGVWIVRSGKNAWLFAEVSYARTRPDFQVQQSSLQDTPGWAVGMYFIPIVNLWRPFTAMRDIVRASTMRDGPPAFLLPTWWTLWILSNIADRFTRVLNNVGLEWSPGVQAVAWGSISAIEIALHIIAIALVRTVTALQTDTAAALAKSTVSEPDPPGPA